MKSSVNDMLKREKLTRREFLRLLKVGVIDLSLLGAGYSFFVEPNWVNIEIIDLDLPRLTPEFYDLRIAQISDIHMGGWMNLERLQRAADLVLEQKPDVLLITENFLIGHDAAANSQQTVQDLILGLSRLVASSPTFVVLGNHDYWTDVGTVRHILAR